MWLGTRTKPSKTYSLDHFFSLYFFLFSLNNCLLARTSVGQDHQLPGMSSSKREDIEKDLGWGVPARIWVTIVPNCGEGVQGKKMPGSEKRSLKTMVLAV